ncbi:MAG: hypothetical protein KDE33_21440 [Bacteroidetes bacterium]|nr:hypothetical protein [Bacteroidota bacterium]
MSKLITKTEIQNSIDYNKMQGDYDNQLAVELLGQFDNLRQIIKKQEVHLQKEIFTGYVEFKDYRNITLFDVKRESRGKLIIYKTFRTDHVIPLETFLKIIPIDPKNIIIEPRNFTDYIVYKKNLGVDEIYFSHLWGAFKIPLLELFLYRFTGKLFNKEELDDFEDKSYSNNEITIYPAYMRELKLDRVKIDIIDFYLFMRTELYLNRYKRRNIIAKGRFSCQTFSLFGDIKFEFDDYSIK